MDNDIYLHQFKIISRVTADDIENIEPFVVQEPILVVGFDPLTLILTYKKLAPQAEVSNVSQR